MHVLKHVLIACWLSSSSGGLPVSARAGLPPGTGHPRVPTQPHPPGSLRAARDPQEPTVTGGRAARAESRRCVNGRYHSDRVESHIILPSHLTLRRSGAALRFSSLTCNPSEKCVNISRVCEFKTCSYTNTPIVQRCTRSRLKGQPVGFRRSELSSGSSAQRRCLKSSISDF